MTPQRFRVTLERADHDERCRVTIEDDDGAHLYTVEVSTELPTDSQHRAIMDAARYLHWFCTPERWRA
jgi:hypothetical protein